MWAMYQGKADSSLEIDDSTSIHLYSTKREARVGGKAPLTGVMKFRSMQD